MIRPIALAILCGLAVCLNGQAATAQQAEDSTATEIASLQRVAATAGETIWRAFGTSPFGFLILESDREVLLCRDSAPAGLKADGTDPATGCPRYVRPRTQLPADLLAAMPLFGPPWTIVMGPAPVAPDRLPSWRSTVLHEHTHQWQGEFPGYYDRVKALGLSDGDESGMWMLNFPFPYADSEVQQRYVEATQALLAAVEARGSASFRGRLRDYLDARRAFAAAAGERNWRYFDFQLWQEGVARWTEIAVSRASGKSVAAAHAGVHEAKMLDMLRRPNLNRHRRVAVYAYGMAEAMLLDACGPAWRDRYPSELGLGPLLAEAEVECAAAA